MLLSKQRKDEVQLSYFQGEGVLIWAQQIQQNQQNLQEQMQQNLQEQMQLIQRKISLESEQNVNRSRSRKGTADSIKQLVRGGDHLYPRAYITHMRQPLGRVEYSIKATSSRRP